MNNNEQVKNFIIYLSENRKSQGTIEIYSRDVKQFLKYFKDKELYDMTNKDIEDYKNYLLDIKKLNVKTVNRKLVAINQYCTYCQVAVVVRQEKVQTQNFLDDIPSSSDLDRILKATKKKNDVRAEALISTLAMTGMRISECLQLTIYDLDKDTINIIGKGQKRRDVFISNKLRKIWTRYMQVRKNNSIKLFTGKKGAITRFTAYKILKYYTGQARVKLKKAKLHNLRHYYAKKLANNNIPIEDLAEILGHASLETSRIYLRKTKQELLDIINDI